MNNQIATLCDGTVHCDVVPTWIGHVARGPQNAWRGPVLRMWYERFVCPLPNGGSLRLEILFEQNFAFQVASGEHGCIRGEVDITNCILVTLKIPGVEDVTGFHFSDFEPFAGSYSGRTRGHTVALHLTHEFAESLLQLASRFDTEMEREEQIGVAATAGWDWKH